MIWLIHSLFDYLMYELTPHEMTIARIYTEDINRDRITAILDQRLDGPNHCERAGQTHQQMRTASFIELLDPMIQRCFRH